ncbi:acetyl-CoA carboxylase biotin carboxylase subunit family protein, partial [Yaniella sp.]|uniref:ATP-grasp domain-containing protein n=1 Tax=Yaniella sp. TaxID=2773929 RepID=UPI002649E488
MTIEEMQESRVSFSKILKKAQDRLEQFEEPIDAIVGYWDFPVNMLVPILSQRYELRSKDLEAVVKCEHKYWSRLEQQKVIDEFPAFALIDVEDPMATLPTHMSFPVWVKPIQSFSSQGAHYAPDQAGLRAALETERQQLHSTGEAFGEVLRLLDLPEEVSDISGHAYMVEEAVVGQQCTLEGYSWGDQVEIIGVVDSICYDQSSSFLRYQYPSRLPEHALAKMAESTRRVIGAIGLRNSTFNIEYFW